jgi:hypothetical protein
MKKLAVLLTFVFAVATIAPAFADDKPKAPATECTKDAKGACAKDCKKACCAKDAKGDTKVEKPAPKK